MNIQSFTPASMRTLVALTERHEDLVKQIQDLEAKIFSLFGNTTRSPKGGGRKGRPPKKEKAYTPKKRGRKGNRGQKPGALKERILSVLQNAGDDGITVVDIASKLGIQKANVHVWFSTTGKRLPEVKKLEPGRFRYQDKKK